MLDIYWMRYDIIIMARHAVLAGEKLRDSRESSNDKTSKDVHLIKILAILGSGTILMVLVAIIGIADTLIAGIILGETAVAGICLALPVYSLASFFAVFFSYGVPILYAGKTGAFRKEEADRCFGVGLTVTSVIGILMFAAIVCGGDAFLKAYDPDSQVYASASEYLAWMKYTVLFMPLNDLLDGMLFADGDESISLAANLAKGAVKVVLSVILCQNMGVKGLALASLVSVAISMLISSLHFFRPGNTLRLNLAFSFNLLRDILKYGIVDASTHLSVSLFTVAINFFVLRQFGTDMLILVSVITLLKEAQIFFEGIGEAITPLISVYLGEECYPGVRKVWKLALLSVKAESLFSTVFLLAFAPFIVGLIGIEDPCTANYAAWGLRIMSLTLIFSCRLFLDSSYFILIDNIPLGIFDSFLRDLFPALPLAVLGGLAGGVYGMYTGLMIAPALGYFLSVLYIKRKYGRDNYPLLLKDLEHKKKVKLYEFRVLPDAIVKVRDEIGSALKENGCPNQKINRAMVIFEEMFMLIYDCNAGKKVYAECTVEIGESIRLTSKDDGRIVDLTDTDQHVDSLRSYALSNMIESHTALRIHSLALSYNHTALEIP